MTSYDVDAGEHTTTRIEIIHESLLSAWPRLVHWRAQDAEGAYLRDELRHQARLWRDKNRPDDLLWGGSSFKEFEVWRERYPGRLTAVEEEFAEAMIAKAERRKRRRRLTLILSFGVLLAVLAIVGGFWRRAVSAGRRAEAATLFNLAQLELDSQPTNVIAYAIAALELVDSEEMRRLALEALWRGPPAVYLDTGSFYALDFSPDGRWLATAQRDGVSVWPSDGGAPIRLTGSEGAMEVFFSPDGGRIASTLGGGNRPDLGIWSFPGGELLRKPHLGENGTTQYFAFSSDGTRVMTATETPTGEAVEVVVQSWLVEDGDPVVIARLPQPAANKFIFPVTDPAWTRFAWPFESTVRVAPIVDGKIDAGATTIVETQEAVVAQVFDRSGEKLAAADLGSIRVWSLQSDPPALEHRLDTAGGLGQLRFDTSGRFLADSAGRVWDLSGSDGFEPLEAGNADGYGVAFDPTSRWLATGGFRSVKLSPLGRQYPRILRLSDGPVGSVTFTPDASRLVFSADKAVRVWSRGAEPEPSLRTLYRSDAYFGGPANLTMSPDGSFVVIAPAASEVLVLPLEGGPVRQLRGFAGNKTAVAIGPQGRRVAAAGGAYDPAEALVRVWDLTSNDVRVLDAGDGAAPTYLEFHGPEDLFVVSRATLRQWSLDEGLATISREWDLSTSAESGLSVADIGPGGERVLLVEGGRLQVREIETGSSVVLDEDSGGLRSAFFDPSGTVVVWGDGRSTWVASAAGGPAHLLLGHGGSFLPYSVSPDGAWIATGGADGTLRLWPMPDVDRPPLHTLPRYELLAKLRSLTNLRAVLAPESPSGYGIEVGPFPGWETVPTW